MNKAFIIILASFTFSTLSGQIDNSPEVEDKSELKESDNLPLIVDPYPEFPGGEEALKNFFDDNFKTGCTDSCGDGKVYVAFTIDEEGKVSEITIPRSFCKPCDDEAIRVFSLMPNWIPATLGGKPVKCKYSIPIAFRKRTTSKDGKKPD